MFCPECGKPNDSLAKFCLSCGLSISNVQVTNTSEDLYRAVIGPKNQSYYLRQFDRFDKEGKISTSWHWPAFLITFFWFLYRKMWLHALVYFLLPLILMIPFKIIAAIVGNYSDTLDNLNNIVYLVIIFIVYPMYANALYYKHCKNKIKQVESSSYDDQRKIGELSGKGGTSNAAFLVIMIFPIIAIIGILAAIAIPAYQTYQARVQIAKALVIGHTVEESIANYYIHYHQMPANLVDTGFSAILSPSVEKVDFENQTGTVSITMNKSMNGKKLLLVPTVNTDSQITWKCMSTEISDTSLPPMCRKQQ